MDFRYAAFTYLYEWVCYDRHFMKALKFPEGSETDSELARKELFEVAKHYDIIRNFKLEEGTPRLLPAWSALKGIEAPASGEDAKERVTELVANLRDAYKRDLWSAASKFLWMRFQSPIVIYDSITWRWMCDNGGCPRGGGYDGFYDAWQRKFDENKAEIRAACEELKELSTATKFFGSDKPSQQQFEADVSSGWFAERVFDHAILIDAQTK
jgi:hypothetical protein